MMLSLLSAVLLLISGAYVALIAYLYWGWRQMPISTTDNVCEHKVSVVIAARNEAANLPALFKALAHQGVSFADYEVILIDDNSEDHTAQLVAEAQQAYPHMQLIYRRQTPDRQGKKAALYTALSLAKHPIIMQTDADCVPSPHWIRIGRSYFADPEVLMLLGAVRIMPYANVRERFQALELWSLIGSTAGAVAQAHPLMSNGSNMAFRKQVLAYLPPHFFHQQQVSGDDMFLMLHIAKVFGAKALRFAKHPQHIVHTQPEPSWQLLWQQRLRWVSKSGSYRNVFLVSASMVVLLQNILMLAVLPLAVVAPQYAYMALWVWLSKVLIDMLMLRSISRFYKVKALMWHYPWVALLYPFFIVGTALAGQFVGFRWKGRRY